MAAYAAKKAKKPGPIAKSSVILDIKPWDDETNMEEMEQLVRGLEIDGLLWGAGKLVEIGYGIKKLQIVCTIEDEKVSVDADLVERIQDDFSDHVSCLHINKICAENFNNFFRYKALILLPLIKFKLLFCFVFIS